MKNNSTNIHNEELQNVLDARPHWILKRGLYIISCVLISILLIFSNFKRSIKVQGFIVAGNLTNGTRTKMTSKKATVSGKYIYKTLQVHRSKLLFFQKDQVLKVSILKGLGKGKVISGAVKVLAYQTIGDSSFVKVLIYSNVGNEQMFEILIRTEKKLEVQLCLEDKSILNKILSHN